MSFLDVLLHRLYFYFFVCFKKISKKKERKNCPFSGLSGSRLRTMRPRYHPVCNPKKIVQLALKITLSRAYRHSLIRSLQCAANYQCKCMWAARGGRSNTTSWCIGIFNFSSTMSSFHLPLWLSSEWSPHVHGACLPSVKTRSRFSIQTDH